MGNEHLKRFLPVCGQPVFFLGHFYVDEISFLIDVADFLQGVLPGSYDFMSQSF